MIAMEKEPEWTRESAAKMLMYELALGEASGGEQNFGEFWKQFCTDFGIKNTYENSNPK